MINTYQINNKLKIEIEKKSYRTITYVISGEEKIKLADIKTDDVTFSIGIDFNEYYIIVYLKISEPNKSERIIQAAYNIKNNEIVDLSNNEVREGLTSMFLKPKEYDLYYVLGLLNPSNESLNLLENNLLSDITLNNQNIERQQIIDYVISKYPILKKYINIDEELTLLNYLKIKKEVGTDKLVFFAFPQLIPNSALTKLKPKKLTRNISN